MSDEKPRPKRDRILSDVQQQLAQDPRKQPTESVAAYRQRMGLSLNQGPRKVPTEFMAKMNSGKHRIDEQTERKQRTEPVKVQPNSSNQPSPQQTPLN